MSAAPLLRPARPDEAARLSRIAQAAKAALRYSAELLESWRGELTIDPDLLQRQTIWVLECDGALQGFFSLHAFRGSATLSHLWVDPPAQRRGFGSMLLRKALQLAVVGRAQTLQVDAEPTAETFYARHGLQKVSGIAAPIPGDPGRVRPQMRYVFGDGTRR